MYVTTHRFHTDVRDTLAEIYGPNRQPLWPALVHAATGRPTPDADSLAETLNTLARDLDVHLTARASHVGSRVRPPVWRASLWQAPGSRRFTDAEWTFTARRIVAAAGIDDPARGPGCPWIAVRDRATERLHLIAPAARRDGSKPDLLGSDRRVVDEAASIRREVEAQNDLPRLEAPADFTYDPERTVFLRSHAPGVVTAEGGDMHARTTLVGAGFGHEFSGDERWMRTPYGMGDPALGECAATVGRELMRRSYRVELDERLFHAVYPVRGLERRHAVSARVRAAALVNRDPAEAPDPRPTHVVTRAATTRTGPTTTSVASAPPPPAGPQPRHTR
ncbi:hypothetical protein [Streptomyces sp. SID3343]|uniref:hypothetical protein n=1 Tax=Streptomyces sp. SID3343 TaxID=2690260 RepID=UPI00136DACD7|nr:hypothetical protein [Streptomyces sp. SID3343]MYV97288.1 hypothetical protein [Streptomyces sp. SID3343]